jgi:hypothetical protein
MFIDNNEVFSDGQSLVTNAATRSTNILDLMTGTTLASTASTYTLAASVNLNFGQTATVFGEDLGIGDSKTLPWFYITSKTGFTTTNAATLQIAIQGAVDPGTGNVSDMVWVTYSQTGTLAATLLTVNTGLWKERWPHRATGQQPPRFMSINYTVATGTFTAGTVSAFIALNVDAVPSYPSGFIVAP